jgi:hypothetical protein
MLQGAEQWMEWRPKGPDGEEHANSVRQTRTACGRLDESR